MKTTISDSEREVMRVLWQEGRPLSFTEIRKALEPKTGWKKSTIQTLVTRLKDKGAIIPQENYVTLYTPNITEEAHVQEEGQHFLNRLFGGSAKNLVAALYRGGKLGQEDVAELRDLLNQACDEEEPQ